MSEKTNNRICAGIVTYNPNIGLLEKCIASIADDVDDVVIIDNCSRNIMVLKQFLEKYANLSIIANEKNLGIAKALNQIAEFSEDRGCNWFMTLDQDSICPVGMLERYFKKIDDNSVGMLCPNIQMRVHMDKMFDIKEEYNEVPIAISSGCLIRLVAWKSVHGFWDYLFIDRVDEDFCYALVEQNWKIIKANRVILNHEIGNPKIHYVFGKAFYTDSYPDFRYFFLARNTIIVNSLYHDRTEEGIIKPLLKRIVKIILAEDNRFKKLYYFIKGISAGTLWILQRKKRNESN